jgi:hypothetical protein
METHGGFGKIYERCYSHLTEGIVFETQPQKTEFLARQRPTWSVYEGDAVRSLALGVGDHLTVNFLDVDPYGQPWEVIQAFFESERPRASRLVLAVQDGLRQKLRLRGVDEVHTLACLKWSGDDLYQHYVDACRELVKRHSASAAYTITHWTAYYTGRGGDLTHYAAVLER